MIIHHCHNIFCPTLIWGFKIKAELWVLHQPCSNLEPPLVHIHPSPYTTPVCGGHHIWRVGSDGWINQNCQILGELVDGFRIPRGRNCSSSHDNFEDSCSTVAVYWVKMQAFSVIYLQKNLMMFVLRLLQEYVWVNRFWKTSHASLPHRRVRSSE